MRMIRTWNHFRYYIDYKMMKKRVRQYAQQIEVGAIERRHVLKDFSRKLDIQVFKFNAFVFLVYRLPDGYEEKNMLLKNEE